LDRGKQRFEIRNVRTDQCLTIAGGMSTNNSVPAVQFEGDGDPSRYWYQNDVIGNRVFQLKNVKTGKCLTIKGGTLPDDNLEMVQYDCDQDSSRRWTILLENRVNRPRYKDARGWTTAIILAPSADSPQQTISAASTVINMREHSKLSTPARLRSAMYLKAMQPDAPMNVIRSAVVEQGGKRYVEYDFADAATMMEASQYVRFRIEIGSQGHPPVAKALLEGLSAERAAVMKESNRLSALAPFDS
jgi:hypothetical protein